MSRKDHKAAIRRDFEGKRDEYYARNYLIETRENLLRRLRRERIREAIGSPGGYKRVLDVGPGPGLLFPELPGRCERYVALDLVRSNLDAIGKSYPGLPSLELVEADLDALEWPDRRFDLIMAAGSLEYTERPYENIVKLVSMLDRGGRLVASFPNAASPARLWNEPVFARLVSIRDRLTGRERPRYPRRLFRAGRVRRACLGAGASEVRTSYVGLKLLPQPLDVFLFRLDEAIVLRAHEGRMGRLARFSYEFIVVADK